MRPGQARVHPEVSQAVVMPESDHPLWGLLRTAIVGAVACFALWFHYSSVDNRDLWTIGEIMAVVGGMEVLGKRK